MNNIFSTISKVKTANEDTVIVRTPMTPEAIKNLKEKLRSEYRMNVYPNQFDINRPYRVAVRFNNEITNHGTFTSVDVASAVGTIVSMATFGKKALRGNFDQDAANDHPEFKAWMDDNRNQETIQKAQGNFI